MRHAFIVGGLLGVLVSGLPSSGPWPVAAQAPTDVTVTLVVEVFDSDAWLGFQDSLLATPSDAPKPLTVTVPAKTGGMKSIVLNSAKFESKTHPNGKSVKVVIVVWGKMSGVPALLTLGLFQQAVFEMQAGAIENDVALAYGVFGVNGQLTEVKVAFQ